MPNQILVLLEVENNSSITLKGKGGHNRLLLSKLYLSPGELLVQSFRRVFRLFETHELSHARLPCPSLSPRVWSNSCPLSQCCHPTISSSVIPFSSCLQSFPAGLSNESGFHIRWPKYWRFSFSISPSNEYSGLISFRIDWFDLAVQGTHKGLLQHHSPKASILWCSAFFIVQLSHPYMTTGKTSGRTLLAK